jgi:hypothetical protein
MPKGAGTPKLLQQTSARRKALIFKGSARVAKVLFMHDARMPHP